jgi:hypothetical protein
LSVSIRWRLRTVPVLAWMVLAALALRLAMVPFNTIEGLMNADHLHCWEYGNVARALLAGQG